MQIDAAPVRTDVRLREPWVADFEQLDRAEHGVEVAGPGRQIGERVVGEPDLEIEVGETVGGTATEGAGVEDAEDRRIGLDRGFEPFEDGSQRRIDHRPNSAAGPAGGGPRGGI